MEDDFDRINELYLEEIYEIIHLIKASAISNQENYNWSLKKKLDVELAENFSNIIKFSVLKKLIKTKTKENPEQIWNYIFENIKNNSVKEMYQKIDEDYDEFIKKLDEKERAKIESSKVPIDNSSKIQKSLEKQEKSSNDNDIISKLDDESKLKSSKKKERKEQEISNFSNENEPKIENKERKEKESKVQNKEFKSEFSSRSIVQNKEIKGEFKSEFSNSREKNQNKERKNDEFTSKFSEKDKESQVQKSMEKSFKNKEKLIDESSKKEKDRGSPDKSEKMSKESSQKSSQKSIAKNKEEESFNQSEQEFSNIPKKSNIENDSLISDSSILIQSKKEQNKKGKPTEENKKLPQIDINLKEKKKKSPIDEEISAPSKKKLPILEEKEDEEEENYSSNKEESEDDDNDQKDDEKRDFDDKKEDFDEKKNEDLDEKKEENSKKKSRDEFHRKLNEKVAPPLDKKNEKQPMKKPNQIQTLTPNDFSIEIRMNFPFQNDAYGTSLIGFLNLDFETDETHQKRGFLTIVLKAILSNTISCPVPGSKECDLVPPKTMEDKFGPWKFDHLFDLMKIMVVMRKDNTYFPSFWKLDPQIDMAMTPFEIKLIEPKPNESIPIDENMPIKDFFDMIAEKAQKGKATRQIYEDFKNADVLTVKDLINIKNITPGIFDKYYGIKYEIFEELERFATEAKMKIFRNMNVIEKDDFFKDQKKKIEYRGKAYKVLRLFYSALDLASEIAFLNGGILEDSYKFIQRDFKNENLLVKIKEFYRPMTISQKNEKFKLPRGILFYGPPGTGKTTVAEKFPDLIGLTAICYPLASTELNRSLVGETEQLITQIFQRALQYPHLLCYLSVDEIDAMVPRRDDKDNKNKGDTVNTILSLIGGIKDIPNLILIASTNFIKKIDEAISRRLSGKFFVGRMDKIAREGFINLLVNKSMDVELLRKKIERNKIEQLKYQNLFPENKEEITNSNNLLTTKVIKKINQSGILKPVAKNAKKELYSSGVTAKISFGNNKKNIELEEPLKQNLIKKGPLKEDFNKSKESKYVIGIEENMLKQVNVALINFTPAAIENFANQIKDRIQKSDNSDKIDIPKQIEDLLEMAKTSSKQINIKFGPFFIPEIYLNLKLYEKARPRLNIPQNSQGLVVVDLLNKIYNFKAFSRSSMKENMKLKFVERKIQNKDIISNINDIIDDIAQFADDNEIHAMQLIDLQSLINNQAFDEQKTLENINEIVIEMKEYPSSLLVFDLDSLVTVTISESSSSMGPSTSYGMNNHKFFHYIKDIANSQSFVAKYDEKKEIYNESFWIFLVSRDTYLLKNLKSVLAIGLSEEETSRNEQQKKEDDKKLKCIRCQKQFLKRDNKTMDVCQYHIGYLFDSSLEAYEWRKLDYYDEEEKKEIDLIAIKSKQKKKINDLDDSDDNEEKKDEKEEPNPLVHLCCLKGFNDQTCKNDYHLDDRKKFDEERRKIDWEKVLNNYRDKFVSFI